MSVAIDLHLITGDKFKDHFTMLADEVASFCGRRIHAVTLMPIGNKATLFQTVLRKIKNFFKKLFGWKPEAALRAGNVAIKAVRLCHDFINRTGKPLSEEEYAAVNLFLNRLKGKVHGSYQARIEEQKTKLFQIYNARHEVSLMKKLDEIELEHVHFQQDLFKRLVKVQPAPTAVPTSASMESVKNDFLIYLTMAEDAFQTKLVTKSGKNTESIYSGGVGVFEEWIEKKSFFTQWHLKLEQICEGKYEDGYNNLVNPAEQILLKKYFIEFQRQLKPKHEKILRLPAEKRSISPEWQEIARLTLVLGLSFFNCSDRIFSVCEELYMHEILKNPQNIDYEGNTLENQVLSWCYAKRYHDFEECASKSSDPHAASTFRKALEQYGNQFGLSPIGEEISSRYEGSADLAILKTIPHAFRKRHTPAALIKSFQELLLKPENRLLKELVFTWFKDCYFLPQDYCDEETYQLKKEAVLYFLLKMRIIQLQPHCSF